MTLKETGAQKEKDGADDPSLRLLLRASLDSVFILDTNGIILQLNHIAERVFGFKSAELQGKNFEMLLAREDFSSYKKFFTACQETEQDHHREPFINMNGKEGIEVKAAVALVPYSPAADGGTYTIAIIKDMTENLRLLRQKTELEHQYTEAIFAQSHYEEQATQVVGTIEQLAIEKGKVEESKRVIEYQATHDPLTGLGNRILMYKAFPAVLAEAQKNKTGLGFIYIDLDNFKKVNDQLGHGAGDRVLCDTSRRLEENTNAGDIPIRLGGDEFAIIVPTPSEADSKVVYETAERVLNALKFEIKGKTDPFFVTASIGVAIYPRDGDTPDVLLKAADATMYRAKNTGKGRVL